MRICESGAPECTGVNPCTACFKRITTIVMPIAMRAGGIAEDRAKSAAFFKEYGNGWQWMLSQVSQLVAAKRNTFPVPGQPVAPPFPGQVATPQPTNVQPIRPVGVPSRAREEEPRDVTARPVRNVKPVDRGASVPKKKSVERGEIKKMAEEQSETPPTVESDLSSTVAEAFDPSPEPSSTSLAELNKDKAKK